MTCEKPEGWAIVNSTVPASLCDCHSKSIV